jgi:hypothetical protein
MITGSEDYHLENGCYKVKTRSCESKVTTYIVSVILAKLFKKLRGRGIVKSMGLHALRAIALFTSPTPVNGLLTKVVAEQAIAPCVSRT